MKIVRKAERVMSYDSDTCTVYEHPYEPGAPLNTADIILRGRYPENNKVWVRNATVAALVNVTEGQGQLLRPGQVAESITTDESIGIERGELYAFDGHMTLKYVATPVWTPEQAEYVEL